jgi:hypothetical protein
MAMADQLTGATSRLPWVRDQLRIALDILDNPGGGLVFGYQALGQARAHLAETDPRRWEDAIHKLEEAERQALWRNYDRARRLISDALASISTRGTSAG